MKLLPNRVAVWLTSLAALSGALAPAVADLDLSSTVGIIGGLAVLLGVVRKWLDGWQAYEKAQTDTYGPNALARPSQLP